MTLLSTAHAWPTPSVRPARDWTPRLLNDGTVYCSPACGCRCRRSHYDAAVRNADALAERMGTGWETAVWENGGWHYSVHKGKARITVDLDRRQDFDEKAGFPVLRYSAWIVPGVVVSRTVVQFIEHADTPEDALGMATQAARTFMIRLNEALADIIAE